MGNGGMEKEWKTKIGIKNKCNKQNMVVNMVDINSITISIITCDVNDINAPI